MFRLAAEFAKIAAVAGENESGQGKSTMPIVSTLIDEFGPPPKQVCLDWAWQLHEYFESQPATDTNRQLTWQDLSVDDQGELRLRVDSAQTSPTQLLHCLLSWSENLTEDTTLTHTENSTTVAPQSLGELKDKLQILTQAWNANSRAPATASASLKHMASADKASPTAVAKKLTKKLTKKPSGANEELAAKANFFLAWLYDHKVVVGSVAGIALLAALLLPLLWNRETELTSLAETASSIPTHSPPTPEQNPTINDTDASHTNELSNQTVETIATVESLPGTDVTASNPLDALKLPGMELGSLQPQQTAPTTTAPDAIAMTSPALPSDADAGKDMSIEPAAVDGTKTDPTVASMSATDLIGDATRAGQAASVPQESELSPDNNQVHDFLMVTTLPMRQIQKLPSRLIPRPREPVWHLTLQVPDGCVVQSQANQVIDGRKIATWQLISDDAKAPRSCLVFQSQISPKTQALQWQVTGSSEDLPNLYLPLDDELLKPIEERMRFVAKACQGEVDRLKQLSSSGVVTSDMRPLIAKQRSAFDSQAKLANRILTIAAEVSQMVGWIDGQVEFYAELRNGTNEDAPLILQFGKQETPSSVDKTDEPKKAD